MGTGSLRDVLVEPIPGRAELLLEGPRSQLPAGSSFQEPIHQEPLNCSQIFNMALWKNLTLHIFVQNVPLH